MATGSLVWFHWNIGWEDKNRVRGTCWFQTAKHKQRKCIGAVALVWIPKNVSFQVTCRTRLGSLAVVQSHNDVLGPSGRPSVTMETGPQCARDP